MERERMASRHGELRWFDTQLKELDAHSELVRASDSADAPGILPGFWHVRRTDPLTGWQTYISLKGHDGGFSEPHSGHLEALRACDLQRPGGFEDAKRKLDLADEQRARELAWTRAEYSTEFKERYLNKTRTSVSFTEVNRPWTAKAEARRG